MKNNIILNSDSYKTSHWKIYPKGLQRMYSYFESRVGAKWDTTVFFGLQYFIKEYLEGVVVTEEKIKSAKRVIDAHMGPGIFNEEGWNYILKEHGGKLPVRIKAVPEGSVIPVSNVMMTIENTDEKCGWITNYLETLLSNVWSPCVVGTNSREQKKIILKYLEETGDIAEVDFKLHNFGARGVSSPETAATTDAAHLMSFKGSDAMIGIELIQGYYNMEDMPSFSIPASEHSNCTLLGREGEVDVMRKMLTEFPTGLMACVSDSFDIVQACRDYWGGELKDLVLGRDGVLVVRPDSGDPTKVLPEILGILGNKFGQTKNAKGYYVLNNKVRVIQGDAVDIETLPLYLEAIKKAGYSASNIAFGSGGGLVQKVDRDVQRFAVKCSAAKIDGQWREVFKDPITAGEFAKKSKAGRLALVPDGDGVKTIKVEGEADHPDDLLVEVFLNGELTKEWTFDEIRKRANKEFE